MARYSDLPKRSLLNWLKIKDGQAGREHCLSALPGCFGTNHRAKRAEGLTNRRALGYKANHAMHMRHCPCALVSLPGWWNW